MQRLTNKSTNIGYIGYYLLFSCLCLIFVVKKRRRKKAFGNLLFMVFIMFNLYDSFVKRTSHLREVNEASLVVLLLCPAILQYIGPFVCPIF